jgi:hypothetical protein
MEARQWKPGAWTKAAVRRCLSNARRQIYRLALAAQSPADAAGIGEAVLEICASEMALEAVENERIVSTVLSISRRLESAIVALPAKREFVTRSPPELDLAAKG